MNVMIKTERIMPRFAITAVRFARGAVAAFAIGVLIVAGSDACAQGTSGAGASAAGPSLGLSQLVGQVLQGSFSPTAAPPKEVSPNEASAEEIPLQGSSHIIPMRTDAEPESIQVANDDGLVRLMVRDAPLQQVLALLAESQKLNLVFSSVEEVSITVSLDRVPLSVALDSILSSCGHTWSRRGDIIHITAVNGESLLNPSAQGRRLEMFELDYSSAADIDLAVKGLLSPLGRSWVTQSSPTDNRRTRELVVVEDMPDYIERIASYIMQADQPPRQVMVEVQILEVKLENGVQHGVNFEELGRLGGTGIRFSTTGFAEAGVFANRNINGNGTGGLGDQAFFIEATGGDLTSLVELLETTNDAKTLASPKLLAVNGQESQLQIGKQIPYRETTNSPSNVSQETVKFLDVGVILKFTPWITRDGRVLMNVIPTVSDGSLNDNNLPETVKTEVATDVFLNDGQGIVIGGLIQEKDSTLQSKIPVLGNIPYAGVLFQRRVVARERSEIIVALMPHLLPYNPQQQCINDAEVLRARDPLLHGPLNRYPRPYEPRMHDTVEATRRHWDRSTDRLSSRFRPAPASPQCTDTVALRRLPPCPTADGTQIAEPTQQPQPAVAMPINQRFLRR